MSESKKPRKRTSKSTKVTPKEVKVVRILNPFDPRDNTVETVKWSAKKTLIDYFPLEAQEVVISVNGKIIVKENYDKTYLAESDYVVVCPVPTGGGGGDGKQVLAIVAMIAVSIVAPMIAPALAGSIGITSAIGVGIVQAGVMMAGSMLVHSIFAPSTPTQQAMAAQTTSSTYGIDGAKNTSVENIPVPVCYGEFRTGANIVDLYVENIGDTQMLYMLLSAGEGTVASIKEVELNGNPITNYQKIETAVRLGEPSQDPIPWFNNVMMPISKNLRLTSNYSYHTTGIIDAFRMDFVAPNGLCVISTKDGSLSQRSVNINVEYRKVGTTDWTPMESSNEIISWVPVNGRGLDPDTYEDATAQANGGRVPIYSTSLFMRDARRVAVRKSFTSAALEPAHYEIRVNREGERSTESNVLDDVYLADINEIQNQKLSHPNTALLGIKMELSDQINGIPTVTFVNGGRIINTYGIKDGVEGWYPEASKNPAWIIWDMLTNTRYGGAMNPSRLDLPAFRAWAAHCDREGLTWNGPIDTEMNVWDAAQLVLRVGHAQLINVGTRYSVVVDKEDVPAMMFSVANMIEGTYKETWLSTTDRANEINVTFFDKTDSYKQRTVKIVDPASTAAGHKVRSSAITLYGVDNAETALKEGFFMLNLNRFILKSIQFSAPLESIACSVGSLILVQTDMTDWALSGRLERGSTASAFKLDRPVTMVPGRNYKILLHRNSVKRFEGTVSNIIGDSIYLSGFDESKPVKRLLVNGRDVGVLGTFNASGMYGVSVSDSAGITVGAYYELHDTDVIEEHDALSFNETTNTLTLMTPADIAPAEYTTWMFGESNKVKKPFRIRSITGSHEYRRDITAIEYNPIVYDNARFGTITPNAGDTSDIINVVTDLQAIEDITVRDGVSESQIVLGWKAPIVGAYAGADVYVSINSGNFTKVATVENASVFKMPNVKIGDTMTFKVVAFEIFGRRASYDASPNTVITVLGKKTPPPNITDLRVFVTTDGMRKFIFDTTDMPSTVTNGGGYKIKYCESGSLKTWATATPLHEGLIKTSPYETKNPSFGVYDFFICAVDSSGNESLTPFQLPAKAIGKLDFTDAKHATGVKAGNMDYWIAQINATIAANKAETAQATANAAVLELSNISSDDVLSKSEKSAVIKDYTAITGERAGIVAAAGAYFVSTTAYESAVDALTAYLSSLAPSYSDTTKDTPIVGSTFRQKFVDVYTSKQSVMNAISSKALLFVNTAQTAATAAQSTADTAATNAINALNDLANIASDSVLSRGEKPSVVADYNQIMSEQTGIQNSANTYGVSLTAYNNAVSALTTYLSSLTPLYTDFTKDTSIAGTTFRQKFVDVYAAKQAVLNAIASASYTLTGNAQTAATAAKANADAALADLASIASDSVLSRGEKSRVIMDYNHLIGERSYIVSQAATFSVASTAYENAVTALSTYLSGLNPAYNSLANDTPIVGTTFRQKFVDVYVERQNLLNAIDLRAKTLADNAQTAAGEASSKAITALAEIASIVDDNVLSKTEKSTVVLDYNQIINEQNGVVAKAAQYSVSTNAYTTAISALTTYLNNLVPSYSDTSTNTPIVGSVFRQKFADVYAARQGIDNAVASAAFSLIGTAQTKANEAANAANTASNNATTALAELASIASDNVLSKGEKPALIADYNVIITEQSGIDAQADLYSLSRTNYDAAISELTNYLNSLTPAYTLLTSDTPIAGNVMRQKFADVYAARQNLLNAISTKAKTIADAAQSSANNAVSTANAANTAATNAKNIADAATAELTNIASDNVLSKGEKPAVIIDYNSIMTEQAGILSSATQYLVSTTAYQNAVSALTTYLASLTPNYSDLTQDTPITGSTFRQKFVDVYTTKQTVLNAIADRSLALVGTAQTTADTAKAKADTAFDKAVIALEDLTNIASDNVLSKGEKSAVIADYTAIINEQSGIDAQADSFGLSRANYDSAVSALTTYLAALTPSYSLTTADTPIVGSTFRQKFVDVYTHKQALLNAIAAKAKAIADAATTAATSANNAATAAQVSATAAMTEIGYITDDNVLSKGEKGALVRDYNQILNEQSGIDAQATAYGVSTTSYDGAITALTTYLTELSPAYDSLTTDTPIVGSTLRSKFNAVYSARQTVLNAISAAAGSGSYILPNVITTAKIAAGQISSYGSTFAQTQMEIPASGNYENAASFAMNLAGLQQTMAWASFNVAGAHIGTSGNYDSYFDGNYWKFNTADSMIDVQFMLFGASTGFYTAQATSSISVPHADSKTVTVQAVFPNVTPGLYNVIVRIRIASGEAVGVRQVSLVGLEMKR